ncbi:apolipoprotein B-100-like [Dasypus novemcinctus]|uniref:apolipoprotein B-100-like n=1 Tax=Dasypus novemcinctus TaxID=9361 RepID=UPI0039C937EC
MLTNLRRSIQSLFLDADRGIKYLKEKTFLYLINETQSEVMTVFNVHIPFVFRLLKENLYNILGKFNEFIQTIFQDASQELQQLHQYIKALREEYFDPSMIGWTVKYYELEEKIIIQIQNLLAGLKDLYSKYRSQAADFASQLLNNTEESVHKNLQEYLSILIDADGKGKEKIAELSATAQEIIKSWATAMKEMISDYQQQFRYKLQDFSDLLSDCYEKFIASSTRLIDLSIQNYLMFLRFITELLEMLQSTQAYDMNPYIKVASGELTINF